MTMSATPCSSYHVGHVPHVVQMSRASREGRPRTLTILEVTGTGLVLASADHLIVWQVHSIGRELVREGLAAGDRTLSDRGVNLAIHGDRVISYALQGEPWRECHISERGVVHTAHPRFIRLRDDDAAADDG